MLKMLVTGASGLLGSQIISHFDHLYNICGVVNTHNNDAVKQLIRLDLTSYLSVKKMVRDIKPSVIIHCAALTDVDLCEKYPELAKETNSLVTEYMISSTPAGCKFVYISTDSVFDGEQGNYNEDCIPNPVNTYARTKLEAEKYVISSSDYIIIRTNFFGNNEIFGKSFFNWLIDSLNERKSIQMFTDIIFSPLCVVSIPLVIEQLIDLDFKGLLHVGSKDSVTKFNLGRRIASFLKLDETAISPANSDNFTFVASRPKNTSLETTKLKQLLDKVFVVGSEIQKLSNSRRRSTK